MDSNKLLPAIFSFEKDWTTRLTFASVNKVAKHSSFGIIHILGFFDIKFTHAFVQLVKLIIVRRVANYTQIHVLRFF